MCASPSALMSYVFPQNVKNLVPTDTQKKDCLAYNCEKTHSFVKLSVYQITYSYSTCVCTNFHLYFAVAASIVGLEAFSFRVARFLNHQYFVHSVILKVVATVHFCAGSKSPQREG